MCSARFLRLFTTLRLSRISPLIIRFWGQKRRKNKTRRTSLLPFPSLRRLVCLRGLVQSRSRSRAAGVPAEFFPKISKTKKRSRGKSCGNVFLSKIYAQKLRSFLFFEKLSAFSASANGGGECFEDAFCFLNGNARVGDALTVNARAFRVAMPILATFDEVAFNHHSDNRALSC